MSIEAFIHRWRDLAGGVERADYQMFLGELCDVLDLPRPNPASAEVRPWYRFKHPMTGDYGQPKRIDVYKQNAFILEAKQTRLKGKAKAVRGQLDLLTPEQDAVLTELRRRIDEAQATNAAYQDDAPAFLKQAGFQRAHLRITCKIKFGMIAK